jgi:hypothetical protein
MEERGRAPELPGSENARGGAMNHVVLEKPWLLCLWLYAKLYIKMQGFIQLRQRGA